MSELVPTQKSGLTPAQFGQLADIPPELEWLANITNQKTKRAYKIDVAEFFAFAGLKSSAELRAVTRAHVIAWRKDLETRQLANTSIRRKLSALSSLFDYLCERNAVFGNPVDGVKRPSSNSNEGSTPALGDAQARKLLDAPPEDTLKGKRDRAILATLSGAQFAYVTIYYSTGTSSSTRRRLSCVLGMLSSLEVKVLCPT